MTKEIKFRAWDKEIYEMCYLDRIDFDTGYGYYRDSGDEYQRVKLSDNLMQYTGLKDKNLKDIYEEDILQVTYSGGLSERRIVLYHEDRFATQDWQDWQDKTQKRETSLAINTITYEVIGNIYESPHLFTKKSQYD